MTTDPTGELVAHLRTIDAICARRGQGLVHREEDAALREAHLAVLEATTRPADPQTRRANLRVIDGGRGAAPDPDQK